MYASINLQQAPCLRANGHVRFSLKRDRILRRHHTSRTHVCKASAEPRTTEKVSNGGQSTNGLVKLNIPALRDLRRNVTEQPDKVFDPFNKPNYDAIDGDTLPTALRSIFRQQVRPLSHPKRIAKLVQAGAKSSTEGYKGMMEEVELLNVKGVHLAGGM
eukprot:4601313-Pyramimonas_sp.AAC.2